MNIAHVVLSLDVGGGEVLVTQLCRLHRQAGHRSIVHCLSNRGVLANALEGEGFEIHLHGPSPVLAMARRLYHVFRLNVPDVVHCHNLSPTIMAAPSAWLAGVRSIISTRHGMASPPYPVRREFMFWQAARCCDRVVAVCAAVHHSLALACGGIPEKIVTLRNGIAPAPGGFSSNEEIRKDGFTLVHVARLAPVKDQASLLRAVAIVGPQVADLRLWIIGDGAEAPALKALAIRLGVESRVRFLGERKDVGRWLAAADLFVLSSVSEGLPLSLLEAMAAGLPAVVTNVGGIPEVARLSGAATVVPAGRPDALARAIIEYATRRAELPALGNRARRCYREYFTQERMADDYLQLYRESLEARAMTSGPEIAHGATDEMVDGPHPWNSPSLPVQEIGCELQ